MQIAYPWLFILLPLPLLIYWLLPKARPQHQAALKVPFFVQLKQLLASNNAQGHLYQSNNKRRYLLYLIWLLLIIAGANPQWLGKPVELPRSGRDILMAIDLSGSMQTPDMSLDGKQKSRLAIVKQVGSKFIAERKGDRLGLVLFGSRAYLQTPLTFDHKTVDEMLQDASIGLAGMQTAIGDAIGLSIKRLMNYPKDSRALILMTDGGNNAGVTDPIEAAKVAAEEGIKIYTIGLGAKRMVVRGPFGGSRVINPSSDLDINLLRNIAQITHGQFFRADEGDSLQKVYEQINKLEPVKGENATLRPITSLYPYPLALALLLALLLALSFIYRYRRGRLK